MALSPVNRPPQIHPWRLYVLLSTRQFQCILLQLFDLRAVPLILTSLPLFPLFLRHFRRLDLVFLQLLLLLLFLLLQFPLQLFEFHFGHLLFLAFFGGFGRIVVLNFLIPCGFVVSLILFAQAQVNLGHDLGQVEHFSIALPTLVRVLLYQIPAPLILTILLGIFLLGVVLPQKLQNVKVLFIQVDFLLVQAVVDDFLLLSNGLGPSVYFLEDHLHHSGLKFSEQAHLLESLLGLGLHLFFRHFCGS